MTVYLEDAEQYQHENLCSASSTQLLAMPWITGAAALSLCAVTRQVRASTRVAYRPIAKRVNLISTVAAVGLAEMARIVEDELAVAQTSMQRLCAVGRGHLRFALTEPGWFDVALRGPLLTIPDEAARTVDGTLAADIIHSMGIRGVADARGTLEVPVGHFGVEMSRAGPHDAP